MSNLNVMRSQEGSSRRLLDSESNSNHQDLGGEAVNSHPENTVARGEDVIHCELETEATRRREEEVNVAIRN